MIGLEALKSRRSKERAASFTRFQSYSSLGGWNFFMNANTEDPDAAYEFIRFMSAPEQQKYRAIEGSV
ncbi:MAG: hypothetical protein AVDCRST_MAG93-2052, partial [uncultured Chloroflexia bacterium]